VAALFTPEALDKLVAEHTMGRTDHGKRLWTLLMLELWMRRYAPTI
jgi:asparagine synthase (glutamine-hydrolysing)